MRITIDTKEDSKEEIKKVVRLLLALSNEEVRTGESSGNFFSTERKEETTNAFANLFGNNEGETRPRQEPETGTPIDFSSFTNLVNKTEKKEGIPKITFF